MAESKGAVVGDKRQFFGHPRGLATLFMTELWERFSYYGMRALLILYMTAAPSSGGLGFEVSKAGALYGLYTAMVYLLSLPGGWIADCFLGQRRSVLYGGILIALGNACLALPPASLFYTGLIVSAIGTGLLKPNVSVMVGQLYGAGDRRRDAGFSIFYMGINLGAFLAPLICGYAGQRVNWHLGFAVAALGMVLGLTQYVLGGKHLGEAGLRLATPSNELESLTQRRRLRRGLWGVAGLVTALLLLDASGLVAVTVTRLSDALGVLLLAAVVAFFAWAYAGRGWTPQEKKRLGAVGVLFAGSALFWCMFEQAGSTLNLFAERSTDKRFFGFEAPASWFQSLNALFIIALAPVFAWLWMRLGQREPSSPAKFAIGLFSAALGFAILAVGAGRAEGGVQVSPLWLVAVYLLHTIGELCLSPVGLSAMTKLAPERITSLLMGVWFVSLSAGNYLGGRIASMYEALPLTALFTLIAAFGASAALVLGLLIRPTKRLMGDVK